MLNSKKWYPASQSWLKLFYGNHLLENQPIIESFRLVKTLKIKSNHQSSTKQVTFVIWQRSSTVVQDIKYMKCKLSEIPIKLLKTFR